MRTTVQATTPLEDQSAPLVTAMKAITNLTLASERLAGDNDALPGPGPETVNSIVRSFAVLNALNANNGSTVAQIASMTDLPRATAFRILETLRTLGYVERGNQNGAFFLTANVLALSKGFAGQGWVEEHAKPLISSLARDVIWPVSLTIPRHAALVMRLSSDFESPMIETRFNTGTLLPLLATASGYAYLAFSQPGTREQLIASALNEATDKLKGTPVQVLEFRSNIPTIQAKGYAYYSGYSHNKGLKRTAAIAVPVRRNDEVVGCLSMRFFATALNKKALEEKFVPIFKAAAASLEAKMN
ncbi:MAG: helix-turn-helix domain-containing protein [Rhodospirillaceae bacterium]|nr:helix-turn-helix domain-containing protein [Rhodospirillaceae bacterium]